MKIANCKLQTERSAELCGFQAAVDFQFSIFNFQFAISFSWRLLLSRRTPPKPRKIVIPFDFVSTFDDGHYGRMLGDMVLEEAFARRAASSCPSRCWTSATTATSTATSRRRTRDLAEMKKIVQDGFGGQIGIWGSVERVPGGPGRGLRPGDQVRRLLRPAEPKVIYEVKTRTNSASEIPHVYVKRCSTPWRAGEPRREPAAASDRGCRGELEEDPESRQGRFRARRRRRAQRLGPRGRPGARAAGRAGPLDRRKGNPKNKVIRFTLDRTSPRMKASCTTATISGRGRGEVPLPVPLALATARRRRSSSSATTTSPRALPAREVYRSQQNLKGPSNTWNTQTEDFTPKHTKYPPHWGRVMLYAYLEPGTVEWDDVIVKQIGKKP